MMVLFDLRVGHGQQIIDQIREIEFLLDQLDLSGLEFRNTR